MSTRAALMIGLGALCACTTDPCATFQANVTACPDYVDNSGTTSSGMSTAPMCNDKQDAEAQCLLQSGIDLCTLLYHPEKLTTAEQQKRDTCAALNAAPGL